MNTLKTAAIVTLLVSVGVIGMMSYLDLPTVYTHGGLPIGCETEGMTRPAAISDARCKQVLMGRYDAREIGGGF